MSRYCTLGTFRQYVAGASGLGTGDDTLLQNCLDRAESAITDYTRRNFLGTAGTAYYSRYTESTQRRGQAFYLEQDLHTLTSLTLGNGQVVPVGSVWLEPRNAGPPYRILRLHSQYVYTWNTDADLTVAGTWGYGTVVPDAVVQATILTAAKMYREKDVGWGPNEVAGFEQAGVNPVNQGLPKEAMWLLSPYRSKTGGAI